MSSVKTEQFSSFSSDSSNFKYYLKQVWSADEYYLRVVLSDGTNFWQGNFNKTQVTSGSNLIDFKLDEVRVQFLQAFDTRTRSHFSIKLANQTTRINLVVKKLLESDIKVDVMSLTLSISEDPAPKITETFDYCIDKLEKYESRMAQLESQLNRLENEKSQYLEILNEFQKGKEELESDLYSKFLSILNAKKAKIRELSETSD